MYLFYLLLFLIQCVQPLSKKQELDNISSTTSTESKDNFEKMKDKISQNKAKNQRIIKQKQKPIKVKTLKKKKLSRPKTNENFNSSKEQKDEELSHQNSSQINEEGENENEYEYEYEYEAEEKLEEAEEKRDIEFISKNFSPVSHKKEGSLYIFAIVKSASFKIISEDKKNIDSILKDLFSHYKTKIHSNAFFIKPKELSLNDFSSNYTPKLEMGFEEHKNDPQNIKFTHVKKKYYSQGEVLIAKWDGFLHTEGDISLSLSDSNKTFHYESNMNYTGKSGNNPNGLENTKKITEILSFTLSDDILDLKITKEIHVKKPGLAPETIFLKPNQEGIKEAAEYEYSLHQYHLLQLD